MDISKLRSDSADKVAEGKVRGTASSQKAKQSGDVKSSDGNIGASETGHSSEKVRLSTDAHSILEGVEAAKHAPDVRAEKVAALRNSIKNGTYKMDNNAIAEKMLRASIEDDLLTRSE